MMVIRKIGIVIVQVVKGNFATRKFHRLKLSTRTFITLNFQLVKSNLQLVILLPTCNINLQIVKLHRNA